MSALKDLLKGFDKPMGLDKPVGLNGLDISLANFFNTRQASDDPRHLWLAALTSYQWGRGHACLDLSALQSQPVCVARARRQRAQAGADAAAGR